MANLFDAANAPTTEPLEIVVGDFIQWKRTDLGTDYPNNLFTATYIARITGGGASEIQLVGTASGNDYLFTADSATSTDFNPGYYHWQLEIVRNADSERIVIERGTFEAIVDLDVNNTDPRTHAEIMVDKIESVLQNRADADVSNYSINGRSLVKLSIDDLLRWRDYYRTELAMEKRKERVRRGKSTGATIKARF
jgi:hypothetical protein